MFLNVRAVAASILRRSAGPQFGASGYEIVLPSGVTLLLSVERAIELLHSTPVVAAMLDMRLPGSRTGLDVLTSLRAIPQFHQIPVLIVTGSVLTDEEEIAITKLRGFVFFKPEGFSTIVNFLDRITGRDQSG